ncbi:DNA adenine methylase [bacterium]|nr:DNA adenine methylase [bacterium]
MSQLNLYPEIQINDEHLVNVASVRQLSPFRYPGGKTWLVPQVLRWIQKRRDKNCKLFIEPFVGGGIISLTIAANGLADKCILVEKDDEIAAVWKTLIYGDAKWLAQRIKSFHLTIESANELLAETPKSIEEKAFQTILKNRTFHGGILAPGSGFLKNGENGKGILSRWYPETIANRILNILHFKHRLEFIEGDAFEIIRDYLNDGSCTFFIDPPYTASKKKAGSRLYRFHEVDHELIFRSMHESSSAFMLTYDDALEIREFCNRYSLPFVRVPMKGTHHIKYYELLICDNIDWWN